MNSAKLDLIILNGRTVINEFERWGNIKLSYLDTEGLLGRSAQMVSGYYNKRVRVIGWSTNLQSSHGVTDDYISRLAVRIKNLYIEG